MSTETINVSLVKGEKVDLTKTNPGMSAITAGMGWDINKGNSGTFDLDVFAFHLGDTGKIVGGSSGIAYFGNKRIAGVQVSEDNLTGAGDGDDESIAINLSQIPENVQAVIIGVNIYNAASKGQKFGMVQNTFIRLFETATGNPCKNAEGNPICFDMSEDYGNFTGVIAAKIYRHNGEWKVEAIGEGCMGDINAIASKYQ